jgi:hypothetical protein
MKGEDKIIELLTETLIKHDQLIEEIRGFRADVNQRLGSLEAQQAKTNLEIKEVRLSVMRLAEYIERLLKVEERVEALEKAVFK